MSTTLATTQIEYPESDGKPMAETQLHGKLMVDLCFAIGNHFENDPQTYVVFNMFLYYKEGHPGKRVAPDVFFVRGVANRVRRTYKLWEEGVAPQVVFEISSRSTSREDLKTKPAIYGQIGVLEYYLFDPTQDYLKDGPFIAMHWHDGRFVEQDVSSGRIHSPALDLDLVVHNGELRLFDPQSLTLLKTPKEEVVERKRAEAARDRAIAGRAQEAAGRAQEAAMRKKAEAENDMLRQEIEALKRAGQKPN